MLALHICGGTVGTLSGFVAVAFRKGSRRHAIAGKVFVISMIALAASGAFMAMMKFQPGQCGRVWRIKRTDSASA